MLSISSQPLWNSSKVDFKEHEHIKASPKQELANKVLRIALPIFLAACCILQQNNITLLERAYLGFRGYDEGIIVPTIMISTYLALKSLYFLSQRSDDPEVLTNHVFSWFKKIPKDFAIGVRQFPEAFILNACTLFITKFILKSIYTKDEVNVDYTFKINVDHVDNAGIFEAAIKGPFLEELFFREFVQGSLITAMKLINLVRFPITITDETISISSRIFSAATFGLIHTRQSLSLATSACVVSFFYETWLYEKNGLFASFGLHFANNLLGKSVRILRKYTGS